jgi:hypothetical protein
MDAALARAMNLDGRARKRAPPALEPRQRRGNFPDGIDRRLAIEHDKIGWVANRDAIVRQAQQTR